MKSIVLLREMYLAAFRDVKSLAVRIYFMVFSWFCFGILIVVLYAFLSRVFSGFAFD